MTGTATLLSQKSAKAIPIPSKSNDSLTGKQTSNCSFPIHTAAPRVHSQLKMLFSWTPNTQK